MATATIRFVQGANTDIPGRAVIGDITSGTVTVLNGTNTGIAFWKYELLYVPPESAVPLAVQGPSAESTFVFLQPDKPGCYRVRLTVTDTNGETAVDIRNFGVPFPNGLIAPPYQANPPPLPLTGLGAQPDELNFGGQPFGWQGDGDTGRPLLYQALRAIGNNAYPAASGSCAITTSASAPSTINLTAEGTLDWFAPGAYAYSNYRVTDVSITGGPSVGNAKRFGGDWIRQSFDFVGSATNRSGYVSPTRCTASDNIQNTGAYNNAAGVYVGGALGLYGYRFRVPADTFTRVLRIYGGTYIGVATLSVCSSDGSIASASAVSVANGPYVFTTTYSTARDGQALIVEVLYTSGDAVGNLAVDAMTLGTS